MGKLYVESVQNGNKFTWHVLRNIVMWLYRSRQTSLFFKEQRQKEVDNVFLWCDANWGPGRTCQFSNGYNYLLYPYIAVYIFANFLKKSYIRKNKIEKESLIFFITFQNVSIQLKRLSICSI